MKWVMEIAPAFPPHLFSTLTGLAWHADTKGRGSYPSVARLAAYGCKAPRSVQRDLRELEELKMIRLGNQSLAEHIPADRRPPVYDLAVERVVDGGTRVPPWSASGRPKRTAERGAVDDTPNGATPASPRKKNGVTSTTERGDAHGSNGATYTSPNPSFEPSGEPLSPDAPEPTAPEPPAASERETEAAPEKPTAAQRAVRSSGVVSAAEEQAFIDWCTAKFDIKGPGWWRTCAADIPEHAETWRASHASRSSPASGLPDWCTRCNDGAEAARYNPKFRKTSDGALCRDCHPDAASAA